MDPDELTPSKLTPVVVEDDEDRNRRLAGQWAVVRRAALSFKFLGVIATPIGYGLLKVAQIMAEESDSERPTWMVVVGGILMIGGVPLFWYADKIAEFSVFGNRGER